MKIFIKEKYADIILMLAHHYVNNNPDGKGSDMYIAMEKTLQTMDMYVAWINNMGFMMYKDSIKQMIVYIDTVTGGNSSFSTEELKEVRGYLLTL